MFGNERSVGLVREDLDSTKVAKLSAIFVMLIIRTTQHRAPATLNTSKVRYGIKFIRKFYIVKKKDSASIK